MAEQIAILRQCRRCQQLLSVDCFAATDCRLPRQKRPYVRHVCRACSLPRGRVARVNLNTYVLTDKGRQALGLPARQAVA